MQTVLFSMNPNGRSGTAASKIMSESSDSSTDEEERQRLRDAVVTDVGGYIYPSSGGVVAKTSAKEPAQARPEDVSDGEEKHPFGTTPEFRAFMRRKLAKHLESILVYTDSPQNSDVCVKGPPLGDCPLFHGCPDGDEDILESPPPLSNRLTNGSDDSSTDSSENERIAEAAVTWEFLFGNGVLPGYKPHHSKHEENTKEKKRRKKKKKEKRKLEGTSAETSCAADCSDEESRVGCGDDTYRKKMKKKRKRKNSVEAELPQSCDASSDEPALQSADFVKKKKKSKKKRKRRDKEDPEVPNGFASDDETEQCDHKKKKKKKRQSVDSVKEECDLGTRPVQNEEQHSCGREKAGVKNCTPGVDLLQHSVAQGPCHVKHKTSATSTVTDSNGVQEKDHRSSCRKHRKRRN